jgi:hypothetical protein
VSKPVFVVGDVHGNYELVVGLLLKAGILENHGRLGVLRRSSVKVVQIGDLANCVGESRDDDLYCLTNARRWFDLVLVGNHEHPYFGGPKFSGFFPFPEIREPLLRLERQGFVRPTFRVGNILVTHAGVGTQWDMPSATSAQARLVSAWRNDPASPMFSSIGAARGGWSSTGGVLWADRGEPKEPRFDQIVGHTPQDMVHADLHGAEGTATWYVDLGGGKGRGRLAGIWIRDGKIAETVTFDATEDFDDAEALLASALARQL